MGHKIIKKELKLRWKQSFARLGREIGKTGNFIHQACNMKCGQRIGDDTKSDIIKVVGIKDPENVFIELN